MITSFHRLLLSILVLSLFLWVGQSTLAWIRNAEKTKPKDTLTVGLIDDTPPFCFYGDSNQLVGLNIDMVKELAKRMGKTPHIESVPFNRLLSGLRTHQYDIAILGSITPKRAKVVRYVTPHMVSSDVLVVHNKLAKVKSIDEFKNTNWKIGVYNGNSYIQMLKEMGLESNMVIYPNQRDVFMAFYKHRVDAFTTIEEVAYYIQQHLDPELIIIPARIRTNRQIAFAVRKEELKLWRDIDNTVSDMLADGTYHIIEKSWLVKPDKESL